MRLFLDECLSPQIALDLAREKNYITVHPRNDGGCGNEDYQVVQRCINNDLVIVTENAKDFRELLSREELHPGLIILPCLPKNTREAFLLLAIEYPRNLDRGKPMDLMVNHILNVTKEGVPSLRPLSD